MGVPWTMGTPWGSGETPSGNRIRFRADGQRGLPARLARPRRSCPTRSARPGKLQERSDVDGKTYKVQYFERAVFAYHPENQPPDDVLLGLVGRERHQARYGGPTAQPPAIVGQTVSLNNKTCCSPLLMRAQALDLRDNVTITRDGQPLKPVGKFVAVIMRVTNLGTVPGAVGYGGFLLADTHHRQFAPAPFGVTPAAAAMYTLHAYDSSIEPGLSDDQVLVFDVQPDATDFRLVVATGFQPK